MSTQPINIEISPAGRIRGPVERALLKIALKNDLKVTESTFEEAAIEKGKSRERDEELIRTGQATPEEIQKKNSISAGPCYIVDDSAFLQAIREPSS